MTEPAEKSSAYEVLARRYRPQTFAQLIGQEHVAETLRNAIQSKKIAHAFLFTGIRGVGKTTAARLLARALNCEKSPEPTPDPCPDPKAADACSNCKEIADARSMDVLEIDGASNRGIDAIRELNDNVRYRPSKGRHRVYVIDEAHMVTREGFNALLKTLEEPPPHVKFIFATTAVDKFPDTIVSRCQRYDFKRIPLARIAEQLRQIAVREGVKISEEAVYLMAREAQGSMRDAESLLDRLIAFGTKEIGDEAVAEVLAVTDRKTLYAVADAVLARDPRQALSLLDGVHAAGRDLERFSRDLVEHWRNLVVAGLYPEDAPLLRDLPENEIEELRRQVPGSSTADLQRLFRIARLGDQDLKGSEYPRLVLEMTLVRMATLEPALPVDEVLARLEEIQRGAPSARAAGPAAPIRGGAGRPTAPKSDGGGVVAERSPSLGDGNGSPGALGSRWEAFLEFVQGRRISLYFTLSHARVVEESPGKVTLGVAGEAFRRELESRETLARVETLAKEFFGGVVRMAIVAVEEGTPEPKRASPTETIENPAVRKAVEVLGGEVREVRNRR